MVGDNSPNACGYAGEQGGDRGYGKNVTCTYGYNNNGQLVPPRGCYYGIRAGTIQRHLCVHRQHLKHLLILNK